MGLSKKIKSWVDKGLLTEEQCEAILHYERSHKPKVYAWSLAGFLTVAGWSIGLGIIALIAANWQNIPASIKLIGYFCGLSGVGCLTLSAQNKPKLWFEFGLLIFMLLCLAGIGLIAQIYHLKGEYYTSFFLWTFITIGVMAVSKSSILFYIWLGAFYSALMGWLIEHWYTDNMILKMVLLQPLFFLSLALFFRNKKVARLGGLSLLSKRGVLEEVALLTGLISLGGLHIIPQRWHINSLELGVLALLIVLTIIAVWQAGYKKIQQKLLYLILFLFVMFYILAFGADLNRLALLILSSLILALLAFFFATLKNKPAFSFFVFALIVRILLFYISAFKSLSTTGFILLFLGGLIFIIIKAIKMYEKPIIKWMEQLQ